jgi:hypothetical protein
MTAATRIYKHSSAGTDWAALVMGGQDSVAWFGQEELLGYQVFGVNRHEDTAWEIGGTSF